LNRETFNVARYGATLVSSRTLQDSVHDTELATVHDTALCEVDRRTVGWLFLIGTPQRVGRIRGVDINVKLRYHDRPPIHRWRTVSVSTIIRGCPHRRLFE
jgi:hypothetical protein